MIPDTFITLLALLKISLKLPKILFNGNLSKKFMKSYLGNQRGNSREQRQVN